MSDSIDVAIAYFDGLIDQYEKAKPLTSEYFVRQGAGHATTMLRIAKAQGAHESTLLIDAFRHKMKVDAIS